MSSAWKAYQVRGRHNSHVASPWKHRDLHPKQAFLTPEICGIQNGNNFVFKSTSNNYFQVQLQMFVSTFVVWTNKGIFTVEVLC